MSYCSTAKQHDEDVAEAIEERDAVWMAAVDELEISMSPENRPESMPWDAVAGYYQALEELKIKMEVVE